MNDKIEALTSGEIGETLSVCNPDAGSHCITCSDEALPAKVLQIDELLFLAQVEVEGQITEIDISLVEGVEVGQTLLVHGGVALECLDGGLS